MDSVLNKKRISQKNILIVDDEENLLVLLDRILTRQGYQVATAQNSYDACTLVQTRVFQLAILDIKMFPWMECFSSVKSRAAPRRRK
jgi:DNA-binding response OmpR family regulator